MSWLNGIPVIGHGKAWLHYTGIYGNRYEAGEAFLAATRSTAVIAGGAAGLVTGGPAGAMAGASGAGALTDMATSVVTGNPQGLVRCVDDIAVDISNGKAPVGTVLKTGFILGLDAVSGLTAGGVADVAKSVTKSMAESTGKNIVKTLVVSEVKEASKSLLACGVRTAVERTNTRVSNSRSSRRGGGGSSSKPSTSSSSNGSSQSNRPSSTSTTNRPNNTQSNNSSSAGGTASGSGGQPPKQNRNNNNSQRPQPVSHWVAFMNIFNVSTLDDIIINGVHVFRSLAEGQKKSLKSLIANLRRCGYLERVIKTLLNIFNKLEKSDVTFQNFLSLAQIVVTYIGEQVAHRNDKKRVAARAGESELSPEYTERVEQIKDNVTNDPLTNTNILQLLQTLISQVSRFRCEPNFRTIYAAVAHYLKHRVINEKAKILTVQQYYELIKSMLEKVKTLKQYREELTDDSHERRELVFDRYYTVFGRRLRIVIKVQNGSLELSSCYIVEISYEGDEEGDEFVDGDKLPKP